jgi:RNA polymerase sigma factor (sigma-70 family)
MDAELVARWRAGDRQACAELFAAYYDGVARFFRNKVPSSEDDLVQRSFLRCFEGIDRLRDPSAFRSFLFAIAHNVLREHLRERSRAPLELESQRAIELDPSPSTLIAEREHQRLLMVGLRHIPLAHQIVLELHYWEQMPAAEIAEVLEEPLGTIKTRLRRAKQLLAQAVAELGRTPALVTASLAELERWAAEIHEQV